MLFVKNGIAESDLTFIHLQEPLFFHLADLPHHGAAVHTEIVSQGAKGKGQGKRTGGLLVSRHQGKAAEQLLPDGALA